MPRGTVTEQLIQTFEGHGGVFVRPTDDEICSLEALREMLREGDDALVPWLQYRLPVSTMPVMKAARLSRGDDSNPSAPGLVPGPPPSPALAVEVAATSQLPPIRPVSVSDGWIPLGRKIAGNAPGANRTTLPLAELRKHAVILASAGSGKTVFLRRIIEETALLGVPVIVVDAANDLSRLGEAWPGAPEGWDADDGAKASAYLRRTETVIWTPGVEKGNPMALAPLPDFAVVAADADELLAAVDMARESLAPVVAPGKSATSQRKLGVLTAALRYYAEQGGSQSLDAFAALLSDLPADAQGNISDGAKLGGQMADSIRAQIQVDPLLRSTANVPDPAELFGLNGDATRISVINLSSLASLAVQQQFVNQLAMMLFSWIKRNPAPDGMALRGLFVIDEAKDFAPSKSAAACKSSLQRLTAQARKYGLGVIFATQAPKDLEHTIVSNCSTHIYGKASSPAAIATIQELLVARGGRGDDVGRLTTGRFYVHNADAIPLPTRIATPMCLSHHPASPPSTDEVIEMARRSRG
jgi:hypothetical protein